MDGAEKLTLDWESLGKVVRRRTLELIALHFVSLASSSTPSGDLDVPVDAGPE